MTINRLYTIWCNFCPHWEQSEANTTREVLKEAKQDGWRLVPHRGEMLHKCPKHKNPLTIAEWGYYIANWGGRHGNVQGNG